MIDVLILGTYAVQALGVLAVLGLLGYLALGDWQW